jgi:hypothetical protein
VCGREHKSSEGKIITGEVKQTVQQHRTVPGRKHEAIAVKPTGIGGVVFEEPGPQHIRHRRGAHRQTRMAAIGFCTASTERKRRVLMHSLSNAGSRAIVEGAAFIRILRLMFVPASCSREDCRVAPRPARAMHPIGYKSFRHYSRPIDADTVDVHQLTAEPA